VVWGIELATEEQAQIEANLLMWLQARLETVSPVAVEIVFETPEP
jgi:hypothetical protein